MIKGRRGRYKETRLHPYNAGDWVMVHTSGDEQKVAQVANATAMSCELRFYKNEVWSEIESGLERVEITTVTHHVPITSIACAIPEEVAKNLLLLQGVEL